MASDGGNVGGGWLECGGSRCCSGGGNTVGVVGGSSGRSGGKGCSGGVVTQEPTRPFDAVQEMPLNSYRLNRNNFNI